MKFNAGCRGALVGECSIFCSDLWTSFDANLNKLLGHGVLLSTLFIVIFAAQIHKAGSAVNPQIAIDSSGNAIAVWKQNDGTRENIYANRFD
tara:strand:- start:149 stop:424 length:276 start_codon:yes stop_codon:yes gene_type:complete